MALYYSFGSEYSWDSICSNPRHDTQRSTVLNQKSVSSSDQKVAQITSTTSQLNELINSYLETYQTKEMTYKFYISNQQAVLDASYKLFGTKIPCTSI
ncbi:hypothetical protein ICE98_01483 [Lactococcus lactis]|nr:hypothetical protein [Lactococcus lactis]